MPPDATPATPTAIAAACAALSRDDADLYALFVLAAPSSLSDWAHRATIAGLRASPRAGHTATTLRPVHARLERVGLAAPQTDARLRCPSGVRAVAWRWLARREGFTALATAALGRWVDEHGLARLALYGGSADTGAALAKLIARSPDGADDLALEATTLPDDGWLDALDPEVRRVIVERALATIEYAARAEIGAYDYACRVADRAAPMTLTMATAYAGVAIARGDWDRARALLAGREHPSLRACLQVAIAMIEGRVSVARAAFASLEPPKRGAHIGLVALLVVFALRAEGQVVAAAPWLRAGAGKHVGFRSSFGALAELIDGKPARSRTPGDVAYELVSLLARRESPMAAYDGGGGYAVERCGRLAATLRSRGYRWLAEQYALAAHAQWKMIPDRLRSAVEAVPAPAPGSLGPSLLDARSSRRPWEIDLDRIEAALPKDASAPGRSTEPESPGAERVAWRVLGSSCTLEPYLQKRSASGKWSAGRKLALKHLMGGAAGLALPPEDVAIGQFVRETREGSYYPTTYYNVDPRAWIGLVGHPRVYDEAGELRLEVVRGEVKVVSRPTPSGVAITLEPSFHVTGVHARRDGERVVVYEVPTEAKHLLAALAHPVEVPPEGKARLGVVLHRLAGMIQVETSEDLAARTIDADATMYARWVPGDGGLSLTLLVRPLGPKTVALTPGRGAAKAVSKIDGEVVQAERDLTGEAARADLLVAAAPVLDTYATGAYAYRVTDPEDALAVVGALGGQGSHVVMEWPAGKPLRVRPRLGRRALRGTLTTRETGFWLRGALRVDDGLDIDLERMLELLAAHPGRYVAIASDEYIELEQDLRELLAGIAATRQSSTKERDGTLIPRGAVAVLEALTDEEGTVSADASAKKWRERLDDAFRRAPAVPRGFQGELRDYQIEGFRWMSRLGAAGLGACLADDMGLGKTVQIIALLLHRASQGPALVVAPTSVCEGWCRELERFGPTLRVRRAFGPARGDAMTGWKRRDVVVTSYTLLQQDAATFQVPEWATAVLDEAQLVKNAETLRAKAAMGLRADARLIATGTPVENHAGDLHSLFAFLNPGLLGTQKDFLERVDRGGDTWRSVKRQLQPFILRRTKAEVLADLPPVTEIQRDVYFSPGEAKLYDSVRRAALDKLVDGTGRDRIRMLAELTRLRRLCCHPGLVSPEAGLTSAKLESFLELAEELVAAGHRALVFSQFTDVLALVRPLLEAKQISYQYLDGSTPTHQRSAAVDAFQAGEGDLFLISLKAGGFGLNLTGADYVIHLDPWWNPAVESQASDRAHRIGQTRPVTVYRLVNAGTIEERIVELHRDKRDLADAVLADTDKSGKLTAKEMRALLESE